MNKNIFGSLIGVLLSGMLLFTSCKPGDEEVLENTKTRITEIDQGIHVEVHNGVVTLSGQVLHDAIRIDAENAAGEVNGVRSVTNNIVATPPPSPPEPVAINDDITITDAIQTGLDKKEITGVAVTVINSEVTISGNAKKEDLQVILQIVNDAKPVKINNNLVVK